MCHGNFLQKFHKIVNIYKLIATIEEIHFISHVVNGIYIIILKVIWYNYMNSDTNNVIFIRILVQISIISPIQTRIILVSQNILPKFINFCANFFVISCVISCVFFVYLSV